MSRRRFYAPPEQISGQMIELAADESHHLVRVLRLRIGDRAFVFDGCGNEYECTVRAIEGHHARLTIVRQLADTIEPTRRIVLAQALAKGEKFDFIVQKATELGAHTILPLVTQNADIKLRDQRSDKKRERWQRIALAALKQCGGRRFVNILAPMTTEELARAIAEKSLPLPSPASLVLVCSERGGVTMSAALRDVADETTILVLIGPEGGWSDDEMGLFERQGFRFITLGARILRTETAAIAALALLTQYPA